MSLKQNPTNQNRVSRNRNYILYVSLLVNLILGYWLYDIQHNTDTTNLKKLERSRGREEMLVKQDSLKAIELKEIQHENRIKDSLLLLKPKEIIIIKDHYYENTKNWTNCLF